MGAHHGLDDRDVYVLPLDMLNMDIHEDRVVRVLQHFGKVLTVQ